MSGVQAGGKLGKYEVRGTLGRGAMGVVYDGWDPIIARRVAIKTVKIPDASDTEAVEELARFRREAQAAGRLTHPNIVGVYDYGEDGQTAYIVMEFVDGPTLKSLLEKQERLALPEILRVMEDVLTGLGFSHARGIVHRDIKPANVMLTSEGQAKIADFGIARIESSSMTQAGTVMGTPAYMSPEQFMGQTVDLRTDLYSAGVLLYQLLTGERPFEGGMTAIMHKALNTEPPKPSQISVTSPAAMDAVVARAMAKRPEQRFPNAEAFAVAMRQAAAAPTAEAMEDAGDATMVSAPPRAAAPRPTPAAAPARQAAAPMPATPKQGGTPVAPIAAGVVLAAALGGAGFWWFALRPGEAPPAPAVIASAPPSPPAPVVLPPPATPEPAPTVAAPALPVAPLPATPAPAVQAPTATPAPAQPTPAPVVVPPGPPPQPPAPVVQPSVAPAPPIQAPVVVTPPPVIAVPAPQPQAPPAATPVQPPVAAPPPVAQPQPAPSQARPDAPPPTTPGPLALAPVTPPPVAPPQPAALPLASQVRNALATALPTLSCSLVSGAVAADRVTLRGVVGRGSPERALRDHVTSVAGNIPRDWRVNSFDAPFCSALDALRPAAQPFGSGGLLQVALANNATRLRDGELVTVALTAPDFPAYLMVSFLVHDGTLAHLHPTPTDPARALAPGSTLRLGDPSIGGPAWAVGPPYGSDMIIAIASSAPLFDRPRPDDEDTSAYLRDLRAAIAAARQRGVRLAADAWVLETVPR